MKLQELNEAQQMLQTKDEVITWLRKMKVEDYIINEDLSIDVDGDSKLNDRSLTFLPVQFNDISGNFYCYNNKLTSLQGAPQSVGGTFLCDYNNLTSLKGGPQRVGRHFNCSVNNLTSLQGSPQSVDSTFICNHNKLTSFEGAPNFVGDGFSGRGNTITSLHNIHRHVKTIGGELSISEGIKSHILGTIRIKGLQRIEIVGKHKRLIQAVQIINANLKGKGNIHQAQEQLLDAGLQEFAQL